MTDRLFEFTGGPAGQWRVTAQTAIIGAALPGAGYIDVRPVTIGEPHARGSFSLRGTISNVRYVEAPSGRCWRPVRPILAGRRRAARR